MMFSNFYKNTILCILFLFTLSISACNRESYSDISDNDLNVLHEKTFNIQPGKDLKLEGSSGDITVTTWDKPQVYVKIWGNEKAAKEIDFSFENDEDLVEIIAKKHNSFFNWSSGIRMKFEVKVPAKFNTNVYTSGGDVKVAGVTGNTNAKTSGGDVGLKYLSGMINISTSGGDILMDNLKGVIDASTSGGDIQAEKFEGRLDVSTSGGNIELDGENAEIDASTSGGNVDLRYAGENKGIELSTSGGDITIYLPADFNASARLSSSGGAVDVEFPANNTKKITSTKFEADLNQGGKSLVAKTSGGNINLRHK